MTSVRLGATVGDEECHDLPSADRHSVRPGDLRHRARAVCIPARVPHRVNKANSDVARIAPPPTISPTTISASTIQPTRIPEEGAGADGGGIGGP
ncbi:hypothetical protein [Mycolicibacterium sarraceniae]|uniref:hypothetical protein n=1 Tax=Mycolicibacterium sarraceniae TaxID=1534348 RepID=UPI0013D8D8FA|nr:hypothetical protein [Mycolicibacterium sarraceniae]